MNLDETRKEPLRQQTLENKRKLLINREVVHVSVMYNSSSFFESIINLNYNYE